MNTKEEFQEYKLQQLKRSRLTAVVLGMAAILCVLFLIYGFTQSIEATRQRDLAVEMEKQAVEAKAEANKQRDIARTQTELTIQKQKEIELHIRNLEEQLVKCASKRK